MFELLRCGRHLFVFGERAGGFDRPWYIKAVLGDLPSNRYPAKIVGRPHLIDWNRDGHVDLVFKTSVYVPYEDAESDGNPKYRQEDRLFVGLGPLERANAVDLHEKQSWGHTTLGVRC